MNVMGASEYTDGYRDKLKAGMNSLIQVRDELA